MPVDVASGALHREYRELFIPDPFALVWARRYSTATLLTPEGPLGYGWTTEYFASLTPTPGGFELRTPHGGTETFTDAAGVVAAGGRIRNLGTFKELFRRGDQFVVQTWDVDTGDVRRMVFPARWSGGACPLIALEDVTGRGLDVLRDGADRLLQVCQHHTGRALTVSYRGHPARIEAVSFTGSSGRTYPVARYEYDALGRLVAAFDALENAERYDYDDRGRMTREIARDGGVFSYKYDRTGRCTRASGLDRYDEKTLRFVDAANFTEVTNSYGQTTLYQYLPTGQIVREVSPLGAETLTGYDEHGRIIVRTDPNGHTTSFAFDEAGNRSALIDPAGHAYHYTFTDEHLPVTVTDPTGAVRRRYYDEANRLVVEDDPLGARWGFHYDNEGFASAVVAPSGASRRLGYVSGVLAFETDWLGNATRYEYDDFGRVTDTVAPSGERRSVIYDALGYPSRVTMPDGSMTLAAHDAVGNVVDIHHANGQVTRFRHGPCRRLLEATDREGGVVRYVWGTEPGRLDAIVNELGEWHSYFRDEAGWIVGEKGFDGREQWFEYDKAGNCTRVTNGNGDLAHITHDHAGRVLTQTLADGTYTRYEYGPTGHLLSAANQHVAVTFERDALGRAVRETQGADWLERRYDAAGNVVALQTSLGHAVEHQFDANGRISAVSALQASVGFTRDAGGREIGRALPGGVWLESGYDGAGRLVEQRVAGPRNGQRGRGGNQGAGYSIHRAYAYDRSGALAVAADGRWGTMRYAYDGAERLVRAQSENGGGLLEEVEYDAASNILMGVYDRGGAETSRYDAGSRLVQRGGATYTYDTHGRLIEKAEQTPGAGPQVWRYRWNGLDQLIEVTRPDGAVWRYKYDALGRRIEKAGPTETRKFVWDGHVVIHEVSNAADERTWIFEPDRLVPLAMLQRGLFYAVVADHLGTPRELLDATGAVVWAARLRPWGAVERSADAGVTCPLRFQGQWHDEESGLRYSNFRYYDAEARRFISPDPIGLRGGLNLFAYVRNPVSQIDPWGLCPNSPGGPGGPGSGPHTHGPGDPPPTGMPPNALHTRTSGDGRVAVQNTVYDHNGNAVAHVDFKPHGPGAPSGHAHEFPPGAPASGHGPGATHIPPANVPPDWSRTPPGVPPATPIGTTTK